MATEEVPEYWKETDISYIQEWQKEWSRELGPSYDEVNNPENILKEITAKNVTEISQHVFIKGKSDLTNLIAFYHELTTQCISGESSECCFSQIKQDFWNCCP